MNKKKPKNTDSRALAWEFGTISVQSMGAMIGPSVFILPNGKQVNPFYIAPWHGEEVGDEVDNLTRHLRGEWPCVPFGYPMPTEHFPKTWGDILDENESIDFVHGYGSHHNWTFEPSEDNEISMYIDYPSDHDIARLTRTLRPDPNAPAVDLRLGIQARRPTCQPVSLHTCLRLPNQPQGAKIAPGKFTKGHTHPSIVLPGSQQFQPDRTFLSLEDVPHILGGNIDASRVPFKEDIEEVMQLERTDGKAALHHIEEDWMVTLDWDFDVLPDLLLWYSNRGFKAEPWNGRNVCLGMEPVCSPFGLSPNTAQTANPYQQKASPTCVSLSPDSTLYIDYRIEVKPLDKLKL
ncbi:hypothetical protein INR79_09835 [Vibrio sp. SCSIO 43132]|uniref:hypothetical protein n=1 Tax=Vibrio sp. SCSIO 43132 TaxID=2779363 RepID=UPI001CA8BDBA|nr:hypothetical protein [Vibrio sp. SCSIO 43132]UAB68848.1 hypothetical protein INR79_09835 [Vibrio sp. SCSIO 43132]